LKRFGAKEFESRVDTSISILEFLARTMKRAGDFDAPERAADAVRSIVGTIALIPDSLKRELYVQKIAGDYHLSEALLSDELARAVGARQGRRRDLLQRDRRARDADTRSSGARALPGGAEPYPADGDEERAELTHGAPFDRDVPLPSQAPPDLDLPGEPIQGPALMRRPPLVRSELPAAEVGLLSVLLQGDPQMLEHVFARIDPDDFAHPLTRELVGIVLSHYVNQRSFSIDELVMEDLAPEIRDLVTLLAIERESISIYWAKFSMELSDPNPWKIARDCLIRIEQERIDREYRAEQDRLLDPNIDEESMRAIFNRLKELANRKIELGALVAG
jgi:DNA primase